MLENWLAPLGTVIDTAWNCSAGVESEGIESAKRRNELRAFVGYKFVAMVDILYFSLLPLLERGVPLSMEKLHGEFMMA